MKILIDSDAFCKLATGGLLPETLKYLGIQVSECGRLPALPHMLRRGSLPRKYGKGVCDQIIPLAESIPCIPSADTEWLEQLVGISDIDPGEAQLFALAAQRRCFVLTGDKRSMSALKNLSTFSTLLEGRIITLEHILLGLCCHLGDEVVRQGMSSAASFDQMLLVCFSPTNASPREALLSYSRALSSDVHPLVLWQPSMG